jgi:hypothetical protein
MLLVKCYVSLQKKHGFCFVRVLSLKTMGFGSTISRQNNADMGSSILGNKCASVDFECVNFFYSILDGIKYFVTAKIGNHSRYY